MAVKIDRPSADGTQLRMNLIMKNNFVQQTYTCSKERTCRHKNENRHNQRKHFLSAKVGKSDPFFQQYSTRTNSVIKHDHDLPRRQVQKLHCSQQMCSFRSSPLMCRLRCMLKGDRRTIEYLNHAPNFDLECIPDFAWFLKIFVFSIKRLTQYISIRLSASLLFEISILRILTFR